MMISQIAPTLHDEIIEFEARISKYRVGANPICLEIVNKITSIVQVLFPKLTVNAHRSKIV
jgi:DNA polymerase sigma